VTVLTLLLGMCAVFLARWWQYLAGQSGSFGAEFRRLRIGRALGIAAATAIAGSMFTDRPFIDDLARFFLAVLVLVGLAAAHRYRHARAANAGWLWAVYVLLLLAAPLAMPLLAGLGFVDNWLRSGAAPRPA
jgi:hypothetical protein